MFVIVKMRINIYYYRMLFLLKKMGIFIMGIFVRRALPYGKVRGRK